MTHDYLSTACHHELHDRCRQVCKFCERPCHCDCHTLDLLPEWGRSNQLAKP